LLHSHSFNYNFELLLYAWLFEYKGEGRVDERERERMRETKRGIPAYSEFWGINNYISSFIFNKDFQRQ
jgi:hypothetical protein